MADPITMAAMLGAGALQAAGTIAQGRAGVEASKAEQAMAAAQGSEIQAVAQRDAIAKKREGDLLQSSLQATAAASGGGAADPTVLEISGDIARESNVQRREIMRQAKERSNMINYQAELGMSAAKTNQKLGYLAAGGQMLSGVAGAFDKYGQGHPAKAPSSSPSWYDPIPFH